MSRFVLPFQSVFNANGAPLDGAKLYFYANGSSTPKDTYSDVLFTTANANPVIADSQGEFGNIFLDGVYRVELKDKNNVTQPGYPADYVSVTSGDFVQSMAELRLTTPETGKIITSNYRSTLGDGAGGVWYADMSDMSAEVATDTQSGVYVAPDSDPTGASGAWVRTDKVLRSEMFGVVADGATDDTLPFQAFVAMVEDLAYGVGTIQEGKIKLTAPTIFTRGGISITGVGFSTLDSSFTVESGTELQYFGTGACLQIHGTALDYFERLTIKGVAITNQSGVVAGTTGISCRYNRLNTFDELYIEGFETGVNYSTLSWMSDFRLVQCYNNTTGMKFLSNGEDCKLDQCLIRYNTTGIEVNQSKAMTLIKTDVSNNSVAVVVYGDTGITSHVDLLGCIMEDNDVACVTSNYATAVSNDYPTVNIFGGRYRQSAAHALAFPNAVMVSGTKARNITIQGVDNQYKHILDVVGGGVISALLLDNKHTGTGLAVNGSLLNVVEFNAGKFNINKTLVPDGSMLNGWVNSATELPVSYWRDSDGVVHLTGGITTGTIGQPAFVLPAGFRPSSVVRFSVASNGAFGECYIQSNGTVYALVGSNVRFSLSGIEFVGV